MANPYIILRNSVQQAAFVADPEVHQGYKFRVSLAEFSPTERKTGTEVETLGGVIDVAPGHVYFTYQAILRCSDVLSAAEVADGWGTLDNLRALYRLNNPLGTPTNLITLVDHLEAVHQGFLRKTFGPRNMTAIIAGEYAHFQVPIFFVEQAAVA